LVLAFITSQTKEVKADRQTSAWLQKHIIDSLITGDSILVIDCTFQQNVDWYDNVEFTLKGNGATSQTDSADTVKVYSFHTNGAGDTIRSVPVAVTNLATLTQTKPGILAIANGTYSRFKFEGDIHYYYVFVWDNKSSKNIIIDYAMKKSTYTKYY
jgi:hypothetical protein